MRHAAGLSSPTTLSALFNFVLSISSYRPALIGQLNS